MAKKKRLRKDIWQEDLGREMAEHFADGFDLRGIKTLSRRSRREGEPEQNYYRVFFKKKPEVIESAQQQSEEIETAGVK